MVSLVIINVQDILIFPCNLPSVFFRNETSRHSAIVYTFNIGSWDEYSKGPGLTGIDVDELNNHLYFTFNRSIYRLDLSQSTLSPSLIASYDNLVFNPRFSASRNALYFCIRNKFKEQGREKKSFQSSSP